MEIEAIIEIIDKAYVKNSSGDCPSCQKNPTISGFHPIDTTEHMAFYNQALNDIKYVILKKSKKDLDEKIGKLAKIILEVNRLQHENK